MNILKKTLSCVLSFVTTICFIAPVSSINVKADTYVPSTANTSITYSAHVQDVGWQDTVSNGATAGTTGKGLAMQAIRINYPNQVGLKLQYQAHVQNIGWQNPVSDGEIAGTTGQGLQMEAIKISLVDSSGNLSTDYSVYYRTHIAYSGWTTWTKDGQQSGTTGKGLAIQAIQICVAKVGTDFYKQMESLMDPTANVSITYNAHVQNVGWQNSVSNGATAGTTGKGLAMEAIQANYPNQVGLKLQYQAHVQNVGWQNPVSDGQTAGTTGQGLEMEAIKMSIVDSSGNLSTNYSVYYRTHIAYLGWTTWTKDGQQSGTTGKSLAIQAIQICVAKVGTDFYRQMESLVDPAANTSITYNAHVANVGWQNAVSNGATAGTTDQNLAMQAIQINYPNQAGVKLQYQAHVQNVGWQNPVSDGQTAGTTGQGLEMEAIKISIVDSSENLSTNYSVYYRTYVANLGWTVWTKDGQQSGTTGKNLAMQAIQIYVAKVGTDFYRQMETKLTEPAEGTGTQSGSRASANLIYFIKGCEGFGPSLYHDPVGVLTEGYGMTGAELNGLPSTISEATATRLLTNNVNNLYYSQVFSLLRARGVKNPSQREVDALTSFAYNLGINSLRSSTLLKLYVSGSRGENIHNEFMKWVHAGGAVYPGLVTRRTYEWDIFSNSSAKVPGYNCAPSISYIDKRGRPTGQVVTENNGYGTSPY